MELCWVVEGQSVPLQALISLVQARLELREIDLEQPQADLTRRSEFYVSNIR